MCSRHLAQGSTCPPIGNGQLRLYNMKYCPFGQRILLVLSAKNIEFDSVNINLKNKPDWFLAKTSIGKVPLLEQDGNLLMESVVIAEFLEEFYPKPPLYPSDPWKKGRDRVLIDEISSKFATPLNALFRNYEDDLKTEEYFQKTLEGLSFVEDELKKRKNLFFGGDNPGMVDCMLWPWIERLPFLEKVFKTDRFKVLDGFQCLLEYYTRMKENVSLKRALTNEDELWRFRQSTMSGNTVYDP